MRSSANPTGATLQSYDGGHPAALEVPRGGSRHPLGVRHCLRPAIAASCNCNLTLGALRPMMNQTDASVRNGPAIAEGHYGA
jgi:hypothetical protein